MDLKSKYEANLKFYTILKHMIQLKLTKVSSVKLIDNLTKLNAIINADNATNDIKVKLIEILTSPEIIGTSKDRQQKIESFITLVEAEEDVYYTFELIFTAALMFKFKDVIIDNIKNVVNSEFVEVSGADYLSLEYDEFTIKNPYLKRVIAPLMLNDVFKEVNNNSSEMDLCLEKIIFLGKEYEIDAKKMFSLIIVESVNQAITSNAGNSYEKRFAKTLEKFNIEYQVGTHDERQSAVEYDFVFEVDSYKIGVSVKRTLRERYKQNHRAVHELGVSKMLIVSLGTDLNEAKMDNILELQGQYILVASEVYHSRQYMIDCERVFSSDNLEELFEELGKRGF